MTIILGNTAKITYLGYTVNRYHIWRAWQQQQHWYMEVVQPHSLPYRGNDLDLLIRSSQSFVHAYDQSGNIVKSDYTCNIT